MTRGTGWARRLRIGTAVALLMWGTVDQAHFYWAIHNDDLSDLKRAAALVSFDSSLQMRLAHQALESGDAKQAEAAWRRAIQSNPADPAPRQALLQFLLDSDRFDEALVLTEASLKYSPGDPNLLVDRGLLESRRGHADNAITSWNAALSADPNQPLARLYLASELDREGKAQAAASHYQAFLERVTQLKANERPAPDKVIAVVLRLADCQARSSHPELAVKSYQLAEKLAVQTKLPKLESIAEVNEAQLQARSGRLDDALRLYQQALRLDESAGDAEAGSADWAVYGRFLDDAGFSPRLAYACIVKAHSEAQSLSASALPDSIKSTQHDLEKRLGLAAEAIRRNPEPAVQEALVLRR
jgi:tetratricopeptide (TPR) repeat protein